ncbi:uncharacterized protein LACBIDRAFT_303034 [Laccaria bicolor S238N-H82]|uniref:Predicted protein n=1 Tax=Laccaria bicolor (strain S238N-H82 / ATCC MYA-4686) TaxID=486041 RepID=B0DIT2_LACBS|nr:uncharacterized protein LACBIDRAFT_303034 [Laccaria bicolor S238N-H82]EDR05286.1 predicted protein [Laccaria bicolor S238N-H82]|eukprot:XP_001883844.1 predicted protein [Laccaria bicolor S238N-H82]
MSTFGDYHRRQRKMFNPVFSVSTFCEMVPTFYCVTYQLRDSTVKKVRNGPQEAGFAAKGLAHPSILVPHGHIGSPRFRRFIIDVLPWKNMHDVYDIVDAMHKTSLEIFKSKKKASSDGDDVVARQIGRDKEIMSILMRANMDASEEDRLEDDELIVQVSNFDIHCGGHDAERTISYNPLTIAASRHPREIVSRGHRPPLR